ncbi:MAG: ABC-2 family transporter protein [Candidatus Riflebacteria bacterium]|nr:ABC-2 family transporter protein [Candidatus Riflebacteria bacterium]
MPAHGPILRQVHRSNIPGSVLHPRVWGRYFRVILHLWKATLIQALEYRASFALSILANGLDFGFGLLQYFLFFSVADKIAGWEMPHMLAFYGIFMSVFSLHFIFLYPNLADMSQLVSTGQLDLVLVKPFPAQLILSFKRLSFEEFGSFAAAQILLFSVWWTGGLTVTSSRLMMFVIAMTVSFALVYSLFLTLLALTISLEKMNDSADLMWSIFGLCRYPVDVFPRSIKRLFMSLIPIAFVTTVPARILTGIERPETVAAGVLLALLFLAFSRFCWRRALIGYSSAGG